METKKREIKFRAWNETEKRLFNCRSINCFPLENAGVLMQFTGLLDKNGVHELYEGDIIDVGGHLIGNIYEHENVYQEKTNLVIQGFGDKNWGATYQEAMGRGCADSKQYADKDDIW